MYNTIKSASGNNNFTINGLKPEREYSFTSCFTDRYSSICVYFGLGNGDMFNVFYYKGELYRVGKGIDTRSNSSDYYLDKTIFKFNKSNQNWDTVTTAPTTTSSVYSEQYCYYTYIFKYEGKIFFIGRNGDTNIDIFDGKTITTYSLPLPTKASECWCCILNNELHVLYSTTEHLVLNYSEKKWNRLKSTNPEDIRPAKNKIGIVNKKLTLLKINSDSKTLKVYQYNHTDYTWDSGVVVGKGDNNVPSAADNDYTIALSECFILNNTIIICHRVPVYSKLHIRSYGGDGLKLLCSGIDANYGYEIDSYPILQPNEAMGFISLVSYYDTSADSRDTHLYMIIPYPYYFDTTKIYLGG